MHPTTRKTLSTCFIRRSSAPARGLSHHVMPDKSPNILIPSSDLPLAVLLSDIRQFVSLFNDITPTVSKGWVGPVELPSYTRALMEAYSCVAGEGRGSTAFRARLTHDSGCVMTASQARREASLLLQHRIQSVVRRGEGTCCAQRGLAALRIPALLPISAFIPSCLSVSSLRPPPCLVQRTSPATLALPWNLWLTPGRVTRTTSRLS